jgi:hypothetical protein
MSTFKNFLSIFLKVNEDCLIDIQYDTNYIGKETELLIKSLTYNLKLFVEGLEQTELDPYDYMESLNIKDKDKYNIFGYFLNQYDDYIENLYHN